MKVRDLLLSLPLLLIGTAATSFACSCMAKPSVLDEFDRSQDVFIAEVIAIDMTKNQDEALDKYGGIAGARVRVEKTFKGNLKVGHEVFFEQGGGANCIWTYREEHVGQKILVYNSPHQGKRYISECGRSNGLAFVADDLRYLNNLDKVRGKTRIAGIYKFGYFGGVPVGHSVEGKKIKIVGKTRRFVAITDKDGVFEIYDLPPGKYYVESEVPLGWKLNRYAIERSLDTYPPSMALYEYLESRKKWPNRIPIQVEIGKHVSLDFQYEIDNSVSGRILDPLGKPIKGICVKAVPAEKTDYKYGPFSCTDSYGKFAITELYFKKFVLVINGDGEVSGDEPIQTLFFPGVDERSAAKVLEIDQGVKLVLPPFKVRKLVETVTLRGILYYSDGSPVTSHRKVQFIADTKDKTKKADPYDYTDDFGRFELRILKGQTGRIRGEIIFGERQRIGCPDILKSTIEYPDYGGTVFTAATEWKNVKAVRNEPNIKLTFVFQECRVP